MKIFYKKEEGEKALVLGANVKKPNPLQIVHLFMDL